MPIAFITLKMVFVLAWIIGEAISLSCELLKFIVLIACGVITHHHRWAPLADVALLKKTAMEWRCSFDFLPLPFFTTLVCLLPVIFRVILGTKWNLR
jgi:hypothetical protein